MKTKIFENFQYITLILLIVGQCVVGTNFFIGQFIYLGANIVATIRNFVLNRPAADKIKEIACLAITIGLILFNFFKINS